MADELSPRRWSVPVQVFSAGAALGALLGGVMNLVNVNVSGSYFAIVMGWHAYSELLLRAAIGQGVIEGSALGAVFGLVVAISFAASTGLRGTFSLAARALVVAMAVVTICWAVGGMAGVAYATLDPIGFMTARGVGFNDLQDLKTFAWVGGSIWGAYAGTVLGVIASCVSLHRGWRRLREGEAATFEVVVPAVPAAVVAGDEIG